MKAVTSIVSSPSVKTLIVSFPCPGSNTKGVITASAPEQVVVGTAVEGIVPFLTQQPVVARATLEPVVAFAGEKVSLPSMATIRVPCESSMRISEYSGPSMGSVHGSTVVRSSTSIIEVVPSGSLNMSAVKSVGASPSTVIDPPSAECVITVPVPSASAVKVKSENVIASETRLRSIVSLSASKSVIVSWPLPSSNTKVSAPVPPVSESSPPPPIRKSSPASP